jgi:hypothetical protein
MNCIHDKNTSFENVAAVNQLTPRVNSTIYYLRLWLIRPGRMFLPGTPLTSSAHLMFVDSGAVIPIFTPPDSVPSTSNSICCPMRIAEHAPRFGRRVNTSIFASPSIVDSSEKRQVCRPHPQSRSYVESFPYCSIQLKNNRGTKSTNNWYKCHHPG